jgi:hypothetical protein
MANPPLRKERSKAKGGGTREGKKLAQSNLQGAGRHPAWHAGARIFLMGNY